MLAWQHGMISSFLFERSALSWLNPPRAHAHPTLLFICRTNQCMGAANASGALVSSISELQRQQQQQQEVLGVVEDSRRRGSRLRGSASSETTIDISHPHDLAKAAARTTAAASKGAEIGDVGETAGSRNGRGGSAAVFSAERENGSRGNRGVAGAQRVRDTVKQGSRNPDRNE